MKKIFLILGVAAFTLAATNVMAQDKPATATPEKTERSKENIQKEADALKKRIYVLTEKLEANKDNPNVNLEEGKATISEIVAKWEQLTGKSWEREKKLDTM